MNTSYTALQYEPVTTVEQSIASVVVSVQSIASSYLA